MHSLSGPASLKKTESPSASSHQMPIAPQLWMDLHETLPPPSWLMLAFISGLILCSFCICSHSHSVHVAMMPWSQEVPSATSGFYNLSIPLSAISLQRKRCHTDVPFRAEDSTHSFLFFVQWPVVSLDTTDKQLKNNPPICAAHTLMAVGSCREACSTY